MGHKALSWQQIVIVLLSMPVLVGLSMRFAPNSSSAEHRAGDYLLGVGVPLIIALTVWHFRKYHRPDLQPDILVRLFNPKAIFQVGNVIHFSLTCVQDGDALLFICAIQNLVDAPSAMRLTLEPDKGGQTIGFVPELCTGLAPAEVVCAKIRLPIRPIDQPTTLRLVIGAGADSEKGQRLRFGQRQGITKKVNPALTGALLIAGHYHGGGGTFLNVQLLPFQPTELSLHPFTGDWEFAPLWEVGEPVNEELLTQRLSA